MTDDLLKRAQDALEGVTPRPWCVADETVVWTQINDPVETSYDIGYPLAETKRLKSFWTGAAWPEGEPEANARFIAAARQLVPDLLAHIAAQDAEIKRLTAERDAAWERGRDAAAKKMIAWHDAKIAELRQQIEANTDYMRRSELTDHSANDACRTGIYYHTTAIRQIEGIHAALTPEARHD